MKTIQSLSQKVKLQTVTDLLLSMRNPEYDNTEFDKLYDKYKDYSRPTRIFLSAPCASNPNYVEHFGELEEKVKTWYNQITKLDSSLNKKFRIINPIMHINSVDCDYQVTSDDYRYESLELLKMCDIIVMGKGWQNAEGCVEERGIAIILGLSIDTEKEIDELLRNIGRRMDDEAVIEFDRKNAIREGNKGLTITVGDRVLESNKASLKEEVEGMLLKSVDNTEEYRLAP